MKNFIQTIILSVALMFSPLLLAQSVDEVPANEMRLVDYLLEKDVVFIYLARTGTPGFLTIYADKEGKTPDWLTCEFVHANVSDVALDRITFKDYTASETLKEESCLE